MRTVLINTPVEERHRRMLEEAAAGRCRLVYAQDGQDALAEAEAVLGAVPPADLTRAGKLQWFHLVWAGTDRYKPSDFPAGAIFTNGSGAYGVMVAEHMMACILSLLRQLPHYAARQRDHDWNQAGQEGTLEGRTVLILGTGDLGTALAKRLRGFDCRILGVRRKAEPAPYFDEIHTMADLDELLPRADVVACALPGSPETAGLLNRDRLLRMKPGAVLVNCGRGSLLDTEALVEVLNQGRLGGCALDVTNPEPLPADNPLWDMENVILTPHVAGISFGHLPETEDKIYRLAAENLSRWLDGRPLKNVIDF